MTEILDKMSMPFVDLSSFQIYFPVLSLARQKKTVIYMKLECLDNMITSGELAKFY